MDVASGVGRALVFQDSPLPCQLAASEDAFLAPGYVGLEAVWNRTILKNPSAGSRQAERANMALVGVSEEGSGP